MDLTAESIDRIVALGQNVDVHNEGDFPFAIAPVGFSIHDLEEYFPPKVTKQTVNLGDAASFIAYVNRYKTDDTQIFAYIQDSAGSFTAIIDYHGKDKPGRTAHRAAYGIAPTKEWQNWMANNGQKKTQLAFATFLEENQELIKSPLGADLLELILNLEGKQHVNFTRSERLDSGKNALQYTEEVMLRGATIPSVKEGALEMPKEITAGIAPFYGSEPYEVKARLKYRIESRNLALWYETIAPHKIMRDALEGVVKQITEGTKIAPLSGSI